MKVALLVHDLNVRGGTQRQLLELARYLTNTGHRPVIYAVDFAEECYPELTPGLEIRTNPDLGMERRQLLSELAIRATKPLIAAKKVYLWRRWLHIRERIAQQFTRMIDLDTDLINGHDCADLIYFARTRCNVPTVLQCNDIPACFEVGLHLPTDRSAWTSVKRLFRLLGYGRKCRAYERRWMTAVDQVVVNVERNRRWLIECYGRDARVFRCGVDLRGFTATSRREGAAAAKPFRILSVGVFYRYRRFEDLILAVEILQRKHDVVCDLVGYEASDQEYAEWLKELVARLGLKSRVQFHGQVPEARLRELYERSDVFVWCNHNQSWGNSVFEAMACGTPTVVSTSTGASEVLTDGVDALLVPPLSPPALASRIEELIVSAELRNRLASAGLAKVRQMSWSRYCEAMLSLFLEMLGGRKPIYSGR